MQAWMLEADNMAGDQDWTLTRDPAVDLSRSLVTRLQTWREATGKQGCLTWGLEADRKAGGVTETGEYGQPGHLLGIRGRCLGH